MKNMSNPQIDPLPQTFARDDAPFGVRERVLSKSYAFLHAWRDGSTTSTVEGRVPTEPGHP